jgi:hypothetical protein
MSFAVPAVIAGVAQLLVSIAILKPRAPKPGSPASTDESKPASAPSSGK